MFKLKIMLFEDGEPNGYDYTVELKEKFVAIATFEKLTNLFSKIE